MIWPAIRAASALPPLPAFSRNTAVAMIGSPFFIANEMNQPCDSSSVAFSAVPVLPPTWKPLIRAFLPLPFSTTLIIMVWRSLACCWLTLRRNSLGCAV
jgi:hypothetical protein